MRKPIQWTQSGTDVKLMPVYGSKVMTPFEELVEIMAKLRSEGGCPWDREQTHQTLRPYLIRQYLLRGEVEAAIDVYEEYLLSLIHI